MTSPAASLRGGAVGALTVSLAVAAHGTAGGAYPSGPALTYLLIVGIGVGVVSTLPDPRSGTARLSTVLGGLVFGQVAGHVALAVTAVHAHSILPSPTMMGLHFAASVVTAALICIAERLYGPLTSIVRAVLNPPLTLPNVPAHIVAVGRLTFPVLLPFMASISRRGPPVAA